MQYPLPSVGPTVPPSQPTAPAVTISAQPTQPIQQTQPALQQPAAAAVASTGRFDPTRQFRAWYPRWWLLSAILCGVLVGGILLLQGLECKGSFAGSTLCQFGNWNDWRQGVAVVIVWAVFLLGWLLIFVNCVKPIEFDHSQSAWSRFLAALSHYRAMYSSLYICAAMAFWAIMFMWILKSFHPLPFAICSIIIFVANALYFHRISPQDRRSFLLGYAVLAFVGIVAMLITGWFQAILFSSEVALIVIGGWAAFSLVKNRDKWEDVNQMAQLDEAEKMAVKNAQALESVEVVRDLFRAMFPFLNKSP